MTPSDDDTEIVLEPVPLVGFQREDGSWCFFLEKELTPANVQEFKALAGEIRIHGIGPDAERLRQRLTALGIDFVERHRALDQPVTEQSAQVLPDDIDVDEAIVRAACLIGFNYAAKALGGAAGRRGASTRRDGS